MNHDYDYYKCILSKNITRHIYVHTWYMREYGTPKNLLNCYVVIIVTTLKVFLD